MKINKQQRRLEKKKNSFRKRKFFQKEKSLTIGCIKKNAWFALKTEGKTIISICF